MVVGVLLVTLLQSVPIVNALWGIVSFFTTLAIASALVQKTKEMMSGNHTEVVKDTENSPINL